MDDDIGNLVEQLAALDVVETLCMNYDRKWWKAQHEEQSYEAVIQRINNFKLNGNRLLETNSRVNPQ